jgi:hypothetical protein
MKVPDITVQEAFAVSGHGAGIRPEEGLPPQLFGLSFEVEWTAPDGTPRTARGSVESLLLSTTPPREVFTYLLHGASASEIAPGTVLRARE